MNTPPQPRPAIVRPPGKWPPWSGKAVVAPPGYAEADIEWVPIGQLAAAVSSEVTGTNRQPLKPGATYPALLIGGKLIRDGHRRYFTLIDGGWIGDVPCVRRKRPGSPGPDEAGGRHG